MSVMCSWLSVLCFMTHRYSQVAPILTTAWNTYITNLLAAPAATTTQPAAAATVAAQSANAAVAQRLLAADLHGCCVRVRSCGNPLHTGREGVVVQVTNTAIVLLDTQDRIHGKHTVVFVYTQARTGARLRANLHVQGAPTLPCVACSQGTARAVVACV